MATLDTEPCVHLWVPGVPQPAGSKKAMHHSKTGRIIVMDDAKKSRPWKERVASVAMDHYDGELLAGPLVLTLRFVVTRPKGHYRTGKNADKLRDSAPTFPVVKPDATKMLRCVEDALTGIVWKDDAQIVEQHVFKHYGTRPGAEVIVARAEVPA